MKHRFGHIPNNQAHNRAKITLRILCYCFVFNAKADSSEKVTHRTRCQPTIGQKGNKIHMLTQGPLFQLICTPLLSWTGVAWEPSCEQHLCLIKSCVHLERVWYSQYVQKGKLRADEEGERAKQTSGGGSERKQPAIAMAISWTSLFLPVFT